MTPMSQIMTKLGLDRREAAKRLNMSVSDVAAAEVGLLLPLGTWDDVEKAMRAPKRNRPRHIRWERSTQENR